MGDTRESREPRRHDQRGRLLPGPRDDYSRYVGGDRDQAALDAKAEYCRERRAAGSKTAPAGEPRTVIVAVRLNAREPNPVTVRLTRREAGLLDAQPGSRSGYIAGLLRWDHGIQDAAGLDEHAAAAGVSRSEYIRGVTVKALDGGD